MSDSQWVLADGIATLAGLLFYVITSHATLQRRGPSAAIAWVLFILLVPWLALPAYLTFGSRKLPRRKLAREQDAPALEADGWAIQMAAVLGQPAPADYHDLNLHSDGNEARAALLEIIEHAQHSIDVCTFILRRDDLGEAVLDRLCQRAREGVRVRVMIDGLGHLMARSPNMRRLIEAGGEWSPFVPPIRSLFNRSSNLRDHRKMLVADAGRESARLVCGGRNLGAEYFEGSGSVPPWRDLSFDLRGAVVEQAGRLFEQDWRFANEGTVDDAARSRTLRSTSHRAQLIASGPDQDDDTLHALLLTAAYQAKERIILSTPYFVPDSALLQALCLAARRGVSVQLLMPAHSNHWLSDWARNRALRSLSSAGARVSMVEGMLHAKLVVIDGKLALCGSANLDTRSLFLNYEVMMAFHNPHDVRLFVAWFEKEWTASQPYVSSQPGAFRDLAEGMLLWTAFQL